MRDGGERLSGGRPATASGVAMYIAGSGSPHVADAQVGEIRGYARLPPPPGWRKCPSLVICLCLAEMERFVVADSLPPPPGWRLYMCSRCSGHVADAQVGEIPGYARLPPPPGWRKCPPLVIVIVSASAEVGRTLRCAYGVSLNRVSVRELSGRIAHIQPSLSALHPSVLACIDACASESSVWTPERYRWWHVARDCRRRPWVEQ